MCYLVCGMMHIKEPLLLIGKSSPCGGSGFPLSLSEWSFTICLTPYNLKLNVLSASLNKTFPSFLPVTLITSSMLSSTYCNIKGYSFVFEKTNNILRNKDALHNLLKLFLSQLIIRRPKIKIQITKLLSRFPKFPSSKPLKKTK